MFNFKDFFLESWDLSDKELGILVDYIEEHPTVENMKLFYIKLLNILSHFVLTSKEKDFRYNDIDEIMLGLAEIYWDLKKCSKKSDDVLRVLAKHPNEMFNNIASLISRMKNIVITSVNESWDFNTSNYKELNILSDYISDGKEDIAVLYQKIGKLFINFATQLDKKLEGKRFPYEAHSLFGSLLDLHSMFKTGEKYNTDLALKHALFLCSRVQKFIDVKNISEFIKYCQGLLGINEGFNTRNYEELGVLFDYAADGKADISILFNQIRKIFKLFGNQLSKQIEKADYWLPETARSLVGFCNNMSKHISSNTAEWQFQQMKYLCRHLGREYGLKTAELLKFIEFVEKLIERAKYVF